MIENLLHEMMGEEAPVLTDDNRNEITATFQYILYLCCTERERHILRMRFEEQLTYRQISACTLISDERVRQIIVSCLKKMNAYRDMLKCGIERYYQNQIICLQVRQRDEITRLNEIYGSNVSESAESECTCPVWIEDMKFSARAYNGLRRAEIQAERFCVPDVKIAVRLGRKTGVYRRYFALLQLFVYYVLYKVGGLNFHIHKQTSYILIINHFNI